MNRQETVDLTEEELNELVTSDKVVNGLLEDLNAPVGEDIKELVAKCLRGHPKPVAVAGGFVVNLDGEA